MDAVGCPASTPVEAGREFECDGDSGGRVWVKVKIKDDQGDLSQHWRTSQGPVGNGPSPRRPERSGRPVAIRSFANSTARADGG
ncbi:DUF4333 domain-containing protein [Streptomyces sp. NPDC088341]|uniref:DUF4333 domain-containing protein n=1 Tax=Streptomyces sp. NPDC088341 TaxID=3154870 RepID=UPI0034174583